ncbi:hypothetical protein NN484_07455, partial [Pseudomonas serboccidentalis]
MSKYINAIVELAECGIAVPGFALSPDDQYAGTEDFQAFIELTTKRDELEKKIEERYSQWVSATGGNAWRGEVSLLKVEFPKRAKA